MTHLVAQVHQITNNEGGVGLSKCSSRKLFGIRTRDTFIRHCRTLGYEELEYFYLDTFDSCLNRGFEPLNQPTGEVFRDSGNGL
jgi:hypothetical protein